MDNAKGVKNQWLPLKTFSMYWNYGYFTIRNKTNNEIYIVKYAQELILEIVGATIK